MHQNSCWFTKKGVSWNFLRNQSSNVSKQKFPRFSRPQSTASHLLARTRSFHRPVNNSLRVAVPSPRGKTGGRERLRKADTNRVMWRQGNLCKYVNKLYFPRKDVGTRAALTQTNFEGLVNIFIVSSLFASHSPFSRVYFVLKRLKRIASDFWSKARRRQSLM